MNREVCLWRHIGTWGYWHGLCEWHPGEQFMDTLHINLWFHNVPRSGDIESLTEVGQARDTDHYSASKIHPKSVSNRRGSRDMRRMWHPVSLPPISWPQIPDITAGHKYCGAFLLDRHLEHSCPGAQLLDGPLGHPVWGLRDHESKCKLLPLTSVLILSIISFPFHIRSHIYTWATDYSWAINDRSSMWMIFRRLHSSSQI